MKKRQLWQAPVVVVLGLLLAGMIGLIAMNAPDDPSLRRDQALLLPVNPAGDQVKALRAGPPTTLADAARLPGTRTQSLPHDWQYESAHYTEAWYFIELELERRSDL